MELSCFFQLHDVWVGAPIVHFTRVFNGLLERLNVLWCCLLHDSTQLSDWSEDFFYNAEDKPSALPCVIVNRPLTSLSDRDTLGGTTTPVPDQDSS